MSTQKTCTCLSIIVKYWKQTQYLSTDKRINKLWYIYTTECCSAIKRNEPLTHTRGMKSLKYYAEQKKPDWAKNIFLEQKTNLQWQKTDQLWPGNGEKKEKTSKRTFQRDKNVPLFWLWWCLHGYIHLPKLNMYT